MMRTAQEITAFRLQAAALYTQSVAWAFTSFSRSANELRVALNLDVRAFDIIRANPGRLPLQLAAPLAALLRRHANRATTTIEDARLIEQACNALTTNSSHLMACALTAIADPIATDADFPLDELLRFDTGKAKAVLGQYSLLDGVPLLTASARANVEREIRDLIPRPRRIPSNGRRSVVA